MLIPLSWLKEYVDIKLPFPELATKLSEAGLTVETWKEIDGDIIFDPEITPNRPDWMSVYGIAREISAITNTKIKDQSSKIKDTNKKIKSSLPVTIKPNYEIVPRITSVVVKNVKVKPSPEWLQKRIRQIGLRPINNLVDITNYVLWIYGGLLHVFDYDKIRGHQMTIELSRGGEDFRSLDGIDYKLPKDAIIIKDVGRVIDLLPLKGGENTAASSQTKNVLLHSVIVDPIITRRTSQALGLRSDSSAIAERGLDPNGTITAVNHALSLILELAGGEVASEIIDNKETEFKTWNVETSHSRIESVLGIKITPAQVKGIYERLGLKASIRTEQGDALFKVEIPTFRNDIHIEEDLIEEVGRIYGYNKFPNTLPMSAVPTNKAAFARNYDLEYEIKTTITDFGYNEINTYSLVAEDQLTKLAINPEKTLRVDNPISKEFEYLRPNLFGNLLDAYKLNQANFPEMKIYEFGKRYLGETIDKHSEELWIWAAISAENFFSAKGNVETLLQKYGLDLVIRPATKEDNYLGPHHDERQGRTASSAYWFHPGRTAHIETKDKKYVGVIGEVHPTLLSKWGIKGTLTAWGLNYSLLESQITRERKYQSVPKYPAVIEDLTLVIPGKVLYGDIVNAILATSRLVSDVQYLGSHEDAKTLHITYLDPTKNLTDKDVAEIKAKFLAKLKELKVTPKEH